MYNNKKISLTITSSKRFELLQMTIRGFVTFCNDLDIIDNIIFFDDSSSDMDKINMDRILRDKFPNKNIISTHFYKDSFEDGYRHSRILNEMRKKLIETETDYFFMLEDDYLFVNHFNIKETIDILENNEEYGYVGFSQSYKNFPPEIQPKIIGDFWEWYYDDEKPINEHLFLDEVSATQTMIPNIWMMYTNWPSFSLRPGINHTERFLSIGEFSTDYDTNEMRTELEFAIRWSKKYKSLCHKNFHIINLAWDSTNSSYTLNNSN